MLWIYKDFFMCKVYIFLFFSQMISFEFIQCNLFLLGDFEECVEYFLKYFGEERYWQVLKIQIFGFYIDLLNIDIQGKNWEFVFMFFLLDKVKKYYFRKIFIVFNGLVLVSWEDLRIKVLGIYSIRVISIVGCKGGWVLEILFRLRCQFQRGVLDGGEF